jgi:hypothetical protein
MKTHEKTNLENGGGRWRINMCKMENRKKTCEKT